ncbi:unnamed protein product, partial [Prorocentrum cordatum]
MCWLDFAVLSPHEGPLLERLGRTAHFCGAEDALRALLALCATSSFCAVLVPLLAQRLATVPRTALSEADDAGVHQVALSLLLEPGAGPALDAVRAREGLWESLYLPEEVAGEAEDELDAAGPLRASVAGAFAEAAGARGWRVVAEGADLLDGFYRCALLLEMPDGRRAAVDVDPEAPPWVLTPADVRRRLKHRHLGLHGLEVVWARCCDWDGVGPGEERLRAAE